MSEAVFEAKITVTVLGQGEAGEPETFANAMECMSLEDLHSSMMEGDLIGGHALASIEEIAPGQVHHRLLKVGNDGTFFGSFDLDEDVVEADETAEEGAGRILRAQIAQGWTTETLELLARTFIEEAGLTQAYANFLEVRAAEENEMVEGVDL